MFRVRVCRGLGSTLDPSGQSRCASLQSMRPCAAAFLHASPCAILRRNHAKLCRIGAAWQPGIDTLFPPFRSFRAATPAILAARPRPGLRLNRLSSRIHWCMYHAAARMPRAACFVPYSAQRVQCTLCTEWCTLRAVVCTLCCVVPCSLDAALQAQYAAQQNVERSLALRTGGQRCRVLPVLLHSLEGGDSRPYPCGWAGV